VGVAPPEQKQEILLRKSHGQRDSSGGPEAVVAAVVECGQVPRLDLFNTEWNRKYQGRDWEEAGLPDIKKILRERGSQSWSNIRETESRVGRERRIIRK